MNTNNIHLAVTPPTFDAFDQNSVVLPTRNAQTHSVPTGTSPLSFYVPDISIFSLGASLVFTVGIIYLTIRIRQIRAEEARRIENATPSLASANITQRRAGSVPIELQQRRWDDVLKHIASDNQNDWRQAIIDADIMLEDLVNTLGYTGETLGEKMKKIARADFNTIDLAWEAHKIRNRIAHDGSEHALNEREVKRIINLYRQVFEEFKYIAPQA